MNLALTRTAGLLFSTLFLLVGCENAEQKSMAPVEIKSDSYCSLDGMLLADFPGPKAQIHYAQGEIEFFCDTVEMFSIYLQPEQQKRVLGVFVNDMEKTDWAKPSGQWIDARTAFYVVGSRMRGSMGATLASFGSEAAAQAFAEKEGGKVYRFNEVTADMVVLDGGVVKDKGM